MIRSVLFSCVLLGIALIGMLFRASSNNAFFAAHYTWLFGLGSALIAGLLILIGYQIIVLTKKLRSRVFGSKLALRLMAVFALMAVIPGGLVYAISVQFLNRSIDSWFDVPVDKALEGALNLGKSALDHALNELINKAETIARGLGAQPANADSLQAAKLRFGFEEAGLFQANGRPLSEANGAAKNVLFPDKPMVNELREISESPAHIPFKIVENLPERGLFLRVIVLLPPDTNTDEPRFLQVVQQVPASLAADAQSVEAGFRDYQQLSYQRQGLKQLFALTLTLAMLLTLFSAIALSFFISERLSAPLSALAEATRAIAKGDFSRLNPVRSRDEFGVLTQSFNTMTRQLAEASDVVARKQHELENAKTYLESILGNLTSGVMAFDERYYLKTINKIAEDMLGFEQQAARGLRLPEWLGGNPSIPANIRPLVEEILAQFSGARDKLWERQIELSRPEGPRTLLVRGTRLPATIDSGYIVVFDDMTHLIQAQRDAAWGEVARRLAHEIKNPLTPIQLSAERLQMKLADKLPLAEAEILSRATHTIVAQVDALKGMVNDFSLYARSARLILADVSLNELIRDVLVLYEPMKSHIETRLAADLPPVTADPAQLRQVLHNLVQNALDALSGTAEPRITIATACHENEIELTVQDNGSGINETVIGKIFEPYVTTKPKGTGLGLAIVKKIVEEHHGAIAMENVLPHGALIRITLPVKNGTRM